MSKLTQEQIKLVKGIYPSSFANWHEPDYQQLATLLQYVPDGADSDVVTQALELLHREGVGTAERERMAALINTLLNKVQIIIADYCYFGTSPHDNPAAVAKAIMKTVRGRLFKPLTPAERVTIVNTGGDFYRINVAGNSLLDRCVIGKVDAELIADGIRYRLEKESK